MTRVHNARKEMCRDNAHRLLDEDCTGKVKETNDWFLQLNATPFDQDTNKLEDE